MRICIFLFLLSGSFLPCDLNAEEELISLSLKELMNIPLDKHESKQGIFQSDVNKISKDSFNFGILAPISDLPGYSGEIVAAADLAAEHINKNGGVNGRRLVILRADDVQNTEVSAQLAKSLVENYKIKAIIGPGKSNSARDVLEKVTIPSRIPLITQSASANQLSDLKGIDLFWRMVANNSQQVEVMRSYLLDRMNHKKIFFVGTRGLYSDEIAEGLKSHWSKGSEREFFELRFSHLVNMNKMDLAEEIQNIEKSGATALVVTLPSVQTVTFLKQLNLHWQGKFPLILMGDTVKPDFLKKAKIGEVEQCVLSFLASPDELSLELANKINELLDINSSAYDAAYVFDAVMLLAMSFEIEQKLNINFKAAFSKITGEGDIISYLDYASLGEKVQKDREYSYSGFSGQIQFNRKGDNLSAKMFIQPLGLPISDKASQCANVIH